VALKNITPNPKGVVLKTKSDILIYYNEVKKGIDHLFFVRLFTHKIFIVNGKNYIMPGY
jgi:hypothetical protein